MTRILPREEWPRLAGTELEAVWPTLDPVKASIVVVERAGVIVACWAAIWMLHVEGLWLHPEARRGGSVARRLLAGMRAVVRGRGQPNVLTAAVSTSVRTLILKFGGVVLPEHFLVRF